MQSQFIRDSDGHWSFSDLGLHKYSTCVGPVMKGRLGEEVWHCMRMRCGIAQGASCLTEGIACQISVLMEMCSYA